MLARAPMAFAASLLTFAAANAQSCPAWSIPQPAADNPNFSVTELIRHDNKLLARGQFNTIGGAPANGFATFDGSIWTSLGTNTPGNGLNGERNTIASWGGRLYAIGSLGPYPLTGRGGYWDGSTWTVWAPLPSQTLGIQNPLAVFPLGDGTLLVEGRFVYYDQDGLILYRRRLVTWNGSAFTPLSTTQYGPRIDPDFSGAATYDAVRYEGKTLIRSVAALSTGNNWNSNNIPCPNGLMTFDGSGGGFAPFPAPALNGGITAMLVYNGELYICGPFTATADNSITLNHMARWTGTQWAKCGNGLNRTIEYMTVGNDGTGDKIHLFTTGTTAVTAYNDPNSTTLDTVTFRGVVRFDGSRFTSYGATTFSGYTTASAYTAATYDPGTGPALYVGGLGFNPGNPQLGVTNFARRGPAPSPDTDGDGLLDAWEQNGLDIDCDGLIDLNLPALGANWQHKDLFIEIDAMVGRNPSPAALQAVVNAFAAAPQALIGNPDGLPGIALHLIVDPGDQNIPLMDFPPGSPPEPFRLFHDLKAERFGNPADRASPNRQKIIDAKHTVFRYCMFANRFDLAGSSGIAELPGDDFMVTLGTFAVVNGTVDEQAGTFMHELGHTLGLYHGGAEEQASELKFNWKPNYHSVMNYQWQFPQGRPGWTLDYSRHALPDLDEHALNEILGIGGTPGAIVLIGPLPAVTANETGPIDWNDNDVVDASTVSVDVNRVRASYPESLDVLKGYEDWSRLRYNFRNSVNWARGQSPSTTISVDVMTQQLAHELAALYSPPGACPADLGIAGGLPGTDSILDNNDFIAFITYFFNNDPHADLGIAGGHPGSDTLFDNNDFIAFITLYFEGC